MDAQRRRLVTAFGWAPALLLAAATPARRHGQRVALVIGNAAAKWAC
jgi:hypothetical protein